MPRIRITGLVAMANRVRRLLAGPVSARDLGRLRQEVSRGLRTVDEILAESRVRPEDLPSQSQKAYRFLKEIDFDRVPVTGSASEPPARLGKVRFPGLRRFLESILDRLAKTRLEDVEQVKAKIARSSRRLEEEIARAQLRPEQLTSETRQLRGWLAFSSDQANLDAYLKAMGIARQAFEQALKRTGRHPLPAIVQFRPMGGLARVRSCRDGTRIAMPTPMVCFTRNLFEALAGLLVHREPNRQQILEAMAAEAYQDIQAELEALNGVVEMTRGMAHDLAAAFGRVNKQYFDGRMNRPRLTWNHTFTGRKFGHYDPVRNTVMVSATLDHASVPEFVVDFIMYHELLHKKHGVDWRNGRARAHTPAFRQEERRFTEFSEAEAVLKGLAKGVNP